MALDNLYEILSNLLENNIFTGVGAFVIALFTNLSSIAYYMISAVGYVIGWLLFFSQHFFLFLVLLEAFIFIKAQKNGNFISSIVSDNLTLIKIVTSILVTVITIALRAIEALAGFSPLRILGLF